MVIPYMTYFFELISMALKRTFITFTALAGNGVKWRIERLFCPWRKTVAEFCLFVIV